MATRRLSKGSTISVAGTAIGGVKSFETPDDQLQFWDATALDSTVLENKTPTGFTEPGSASIEMFFDPADAGQAALAAAHGTADVKAIAITTPGSGAAAWAGYVQFRVKADSGNGLMATASITGTSIAEF